MGNEECCCEPECGCAICTSDCLNNIADWDESSVSVDGVGATAHYSINNLGTQSLESYVNACITADSRLSLFSSTLIDCYRSVSNPDIDHGCAVSAQSGSVDWQFGAFFYWPNGDTTTRVRYQVTKQFAGGQASYTFDEELSSTRTWDCTDFTATKTLNKCWESSAFGAPGTIGIVLTLRRDP